MSDLIDQRTEEERAAQRSILIQDALSVGDDAPLQQRLGARAVLVKDISQRLGVERATVRDLFGDEYSEDARELPRLRSFYESKDLRALWSDKRKAAEDAAAKGIDALYDVAVGDKSWLGQAAEWTAQGVGAVSDAGFQAPMSDDLVDALDAARDQRLTDDVRKSVREANARLRDYRSKLEAPVERARIAGGPQGFQNVMQSIRAAESAASLPARYEGQDADEALVREWSGIARKAATGQKYLSEQRQTQPALAGAAILPHLKDSRSADILAKGFGGKGVAGSLDLWWSDEDKRTWMQLPKEDRDLLAPVLAAQAKAKDEWAVVDFGRAMWHMTKVQASNLNHFCERIITQAVNDSDSFKNLESAWTSVAGNPVVAFNPYEELMRGRAPNEADMGPIFRNIQKWEEEWGSLQDVRDAAFKTGDNHYLVTDWFIEAGRQIPYMVQAAVPGLIAASTATDIIRARASQGLPVSSTADLVDAFVAGVAVEGLEHLQIKGILGAGGGVRSIKDRIELYRFLRPLVMAKTFGKELGHELGEEVSQDLVQTWAENRGVDRDTAAEWARTVFDTIEQGYGSFGVMVAGGMAKNVYQGRRGMLTGKDLKDSLDSAGRYVAEMTGANGPAPLPTADRMEAWSAHLGELARGYFAQGGSAKGDAWLEGLGYSKEMSELMGGLFRSVFKAIGGNANLTQEQREESLRAFFGGRSFRGTEAILRDMYPGASFDVDKETGKLHIRREINGKTTDTTLEIGEIAMATVQEVRADPQLQTSLAEELGIPVEKLLAMSDEAMEQAIAGLTPEGFFQLTDENGNVVDSVALGALSGRIKLAPGVVGGFNHEQFHAFISYLRVSNQLSEEDVKRLRERFGDARPGVDELFNEEAAANFYRDQFALPVPFAEEGPMEKVFRRAGELADRGLELLHLKKARETAEEALVNDVATGNFRGVQILRPTPPKQAGKPRVGAHEPPEPAKPGEAGQTETQPERNGNATETQPEAPTEPAGGASSWSAVTPDGSMKLSGTWAVIDAWNLLTSADEGYDQAIQPRDWTSMASDEQVHSIARSLAAPRLMDSPTTDNGAPLVSADAMVLSGNGRTLAIREAYKIGTAGDYAASVRDKARKLGIVVPDSMRAPELVRMLDASTPREDLVHAAELSNRPQILSRNEAETAEADAATVLQGGMLDLLQPGENGELLGEANRAFMDAFINATGDHGMRTADGFPTAEAQKRVRRAVLAALFQDLPNKRDLIRSAVEDGEELHVTRELAGLMRGAPAILQAASERPAYDLRQEIGLALADYLDFKRQGGGDVEAFLAQGQLFDPRPPEVEAIVRELGRRQNAAEIADFLGEYARRARLQAAEGQGMLFEDVAPPSKLDLIRRSAEVTRPENGVPAGARWSVVSDKDLLSRLESGPTVRVYRAMQLRDGKLYPPMAAKVNGEWVDPTEPGKWYQADEHPELAMPVIDEKTGKQKVDKKTGRPVFAFKLDKGNQSSIQAAYNPYWHTSRTPLNDQFSSASERPEIVIVECEVPASELTSDYKAEKAKDSVGEKDWHSGPVSSWLAEYGNRRKVILSRFNKVVRVVPDSEVAAEVKRMLEGTDVSIPEGVVTPSLRAELEKIGVDISRQSRSAYSWKKLKGEKKPRTIRIPHFKSGAFKNSATREDIVNAGKKSVRKAGGKDTPDGLMLNIPAFGDVIVVGRRGLKHGLRPFGKNYGHLENIDNADIMPVVGEILKNSVPVNEVRPHEGQGTDGATILFGAAFDERGNLVPVVSVVNHIRDTGKRPPVAMFPLYSVNTKERLDHAFDTQTVEDALSEVNLADLISEVKDEIPIFSKDVYDHFKQERPAGSDFGTLRFSFASTIGGRNVFGMEGQSEAARMEAAGASREDIWRKTGWWKGKDGKWRVEIPDLSLKDHVVEAVRDVLDRQAGFSFDNLPTGEEAEGNFGFNVLVADAFILRAERRLWEAAVRDNAESWRRDLLTVESAPLESEEFRAGVARMIPLAREVVDGEALEYAIKENGNYNFKKIATDLLRFMGLQVRDPSGGLIERDMEQERNRIDGGFRFAAETVVDLGTLAWTDNAPLFRAYSFLRGVPVEFRKLSGAYAEADPTPGRYRIIVDADRFRKNPSTLLSSLAHEVQHLIQAEEGLAKGGDVRTAHNAFLDRKNRELETLSAAKDRAKEELLRMSIPADASAEDRAAFDQARMEKGREVMRLVAKYDETMREKLQRDPFESYRRLAGETEARAVQARLAMTPEERGSTPPWESYDVDETDQVIRYSFQSATPYDPRSFVPKVRGGWTEAKILSYLKKNGSLHGIRSASRLIAEFDSVEELKAHMFYHGTGHGVSDLKPSMTKSERWAQANGGGGYGQRYWGVSVSKSKRVASAFGGPTSIGVSIYPVVLAKNANVIDRPDLNDANEVDEHLVELWNAGVDAVRLGDWSKDSSEQELLVLNPRAICNVGTSTFYRYYKLGSEENPLDIKSDEQIAEMLEIAKGYVGYSPEERFGKPRRPSLFEPGTGLTEMKPAEQREREKAEYEAAVNEWAMSERGRAAFEYESSVRNAVRWSFSPSDVFAPTGDEREREIPVSALVTYTREPEESVRNAARFMVEARDGRREKRAPLLVADRGDGAFVVVDGTATATVLASTGSETALALVVGPDRGNRLANSHYAVREEGVKDADGNKIVLRNEGLDGKTGEAALAASYAKAEENVDALHALAQATAEEIGGKAAQRPPNKENGKPMKGLKRARQKLAGDYGGDGSRVIDLIGEEIWIDPSGDLTDVLKALRKNLPAGATIARVKFLSNPDAGGYWDVKVSVRFANGVIGEIILGDKNLLDAKHNRGGHELYDFQRELYPFTTTDATADELYKALREIELAIYSHNTPQADARRATWDSAKASASSSLTRLAPSLGVSSAFRGKLKDLLSGSQLISPASVNSQATPAFSLIQNDIGEPPVSSGDTTAPTTENLPNQTSEVNRKNVDGRSTSGRRGFARRPGYDYGRETWLISIIADDLLRHRSRPDSEYERYKANLHADGITLDEAKKQAAAFLDRERELAGKAGAVGSKESPAALSLDETLAGRSFDQILGAVEADRGVAEMLKAAAMHGAGLGEKWGRRAQAGMDRARKNAVAEARGRDFDDLQRWHGIDVAATLLGIDPEKFGGRRVRKDEEERTDEEEGGAGENGEEVSREELLSRLTPEQRAEVESAQTEAEGRLRLLMALFHGWRAQRESERRKAARRAEEEARRQERKQEGKDGEAPSSADAEADALEDVPDFTLFTVPQELIELCKVDVNNAEEMAAFLRLAFCDWLVRTSGGELTMQTVFEGRPENVEKYRRTMQSALDSLSRKLLDPERGTLIRHVTKHIERIGRGLRPDVIEGRTAAILRIIQANAVRRSQNDLIAELDKDLEKMGVRGRKLDKMERDADRKIRGEREETVRWIRQIITWGPRKIAAETDKLMADMDLRRNAYGEAGAAQEDVFEDVVYHRAAERLAALQKYGGLRYKMPGEILSAGNELRQWLEYSREEHLGKWEAFQQENDRIAEALRAAVARPERPALNREKAHQRFLRRWADESICTLSQRLDLLLAGATGEARVAGENAKVEILKLVAFGSQQRAVLMKQYAREFEEAVGRACSGAQDEKGRPLTVKAMLEHLDEKIPDELSRRITRQRHFQTKGRDGRLTYGQALQILAYLEQTATYAENIELHERTGQAEALREALPASDIALLHELRTIYGQRREALSEAVMEVTGFPVWSPDPLYMPVRMYSEGRDGLDVRVQGSWNPLASSLTPRIRNGRDVNESLSIVDLYNQSAQATADAIAFGVRGIRLRSVLARGTVKQAVIDAEGKEAASALVAQLTDTLTGGERTGSGSAALGALRGFNTAATYAFLAWNPASMLKQMTSVPAWAPLLPRGMRDVLNYVTHFDAAAARELIEAPGFAARYGLEGLGLERARAILTDPKLNWVQKYHQLGLIGLQIGDAIPGILVGQGVYKSIWKDLVDGGKDPASAREEAAARTWEMIEECQQSDLQQNLPEIMRRYGVFGRSVMKFATSPLMQASWEINAIRVWRRSGSAEDRRKAIDAVIANHVLMPAMIWIVQNLVGAALGQDPDDEDAWRLRDLAVFSVLGSFGRFYVIGPILENAVRKFAGMRTYTSDATPGLSWAKKTASDAFGAGAYLVDGDYDRAVDSLLRTVGDVSAPAKMAIKAAKNYAE